MMNINLTLLGEMITFAILIWITMKYIWPPIVNAMEQRRKQIADGLAAAERGERGLKLAQEKVKKDLKKTKIDANNIIIEANNQAAKIIEEAKIVASVAKDKIINLAETEIAAEVETAKQKLRAELGDLAVMLAEKILQRNVSAADNQKLIDNFITEIEENG